MYVCSAVSDSLQPHGLQPTRLFCSQDFPGKLQGVSPTQGLNSDLLHLLNIAVFFFLNITVLIPLTRVLCCAFVSSQHFQRSDFSSVQKAIITFILLVIALSYIQRKQKSLSFDYGHVFNRKCFKFSSIRNYL